MTQYIDPRTEAVRILREAEKVAQSNHPYSSTISDQLLRVSDRYLALGREGFQIKVEDEPETDAHQVCSSAHPRKVDAFL